MQPRDSQGRYVRKDTARTDGWEDQLRTAVTANPTRASVGSFVMAESLDQMMLDDLYRGDAFSRKVVDIPAEEMTREWIIIEGDDGKVMAELARVGAKTNLRDGLRWSALYGGAVVLMGIEDGRGLAQPVNENNVQRLAFLRPYDRFQISFKSDDMDDDPESERYGLPERYTVRGYSGAKTFKVHHTRLLIFDGADAPERIRKNQQGWGDSALQAVYRELQNFGMSKVYSTSMLRDFVQTLLKISNLSDMIAAGQGDELKKRLDLMDLARSVLNSIIIDADEDYSKQSSSIAGVPDLIDRLMIALSGATGIPATKLFGQSPAGMNATGESDLRNFYDMLKSRQEDVLLPPLNRLVHLAGLALKVNTENMQVVFNPLWQMTDEQEANYRKTVAETDEMYVSMGALDGQIVARNRFGGGTFSAETVMTAAEINALEPDDPEPDDT